MAENRSYCDAAFLREHIRSIIAFYDPVCIDREYEDSDALSSSVRSRPAP
jgi:hypothetical protein